MPVFCVFGVVRRTPKPLHQKCRQKCVSIPSICVFELHRAKKYVSMVWHPERSYLCTKIAMISVLGYQVWVCLKCTIPKHFLALHISKTPTPGIQIPCWSHFWCRGMRTWHATPYTLSWVFCVSNTPIQPTQTEIYSQFRGRGVRVRRATAYTHCFLSLCSSHTCKKSYLETVSWPLLVQRYASSVLAYGVQLCGCQGRQLRTQTPFFGLMHFKHPHPRYPKTRLLDCRVQWYGCFRRHPRTQTIFFGILHFKHPHPRCPKTTLLTCRAHWYGCLGHHPRNQTIISGILHFKHPHPGSSEEDSACSL